MRKKKLPGTSKNFGVQQLVFECCGQSCVWLGGCVSVNATKPEDKQQDPGPFVAFFSDVVGGIEGDARMCMRLISPSQSILMTLERWPIGSLKLRQLHLPQNRRGEVPRHGTGGTVFWQDHSFHRVQSFERTAPGSEEKTLWLHARFLHEKSKHLFVPAATRRAPAMKRAPKRRKDATAASAGMLRDSASRYLGRGYLVGNMWVSLVFDEVVHLGGQTKPWEVSGLTRNILQVLIENGTRPGLTGRNLYNRALELYIADHPGCELIKDNTELASMPYKPICQFFRLTRDGGRLDHPIYGHVVVHGRHGATYTLESELVDEGDPRLLAFGR